MLPLPWELNQLIIDQFHDDKASLLACCLVSKGAIQHARRHLFLQITINLKFDSSHHWDAFLNVLSRSSTDIGGYVRVLRLVGASYRWYGEQCALLARTFPRVLEFEIRNAAWLATETPSIGRLLMRQALGLHSVTRLSLSNISFSSSAHMQTVITSFPNCDTLEFSFARIQPAAFLGTGSRMPAIRRLHLGVGDKPLIIDWILAKVRPLQITSLIIHDICEEDGPALGRLLRALGDNLQNLSVTFKVYSRLMETLDTIDLSRNTELRTLVFDDWLMSTWTPREWSARLLGKVHPGNLQAITFRFRAPNIENLPWNETAPFLNKFPFPKLQLVRFENSHPTEAAREQQYIHNRLPMLATKNLVEYIATPLGIKPFPWDLLQAP